MSIRTGYFTIFSLLLLWSCRSATVAPAPAVMPPANRAYSVQAVLWQQRAAEYQALCHQAFNVARLELDRVLQDRTPGDQPMAIVTDVDETALDNSPFNARLIETDDNYTREEWVRWGQLQQATPVPGALAFFTYAAEQGVEVFYVSNRYTTQLAETKANLQQLGFPNVDDAHVLLRASTSGKEARRTAVSASHEVVMLLGDNLSDFAAAFDAPLGEERAALVTDLKASFGTRYIVLPNPMYGDWETKGLYGGRYDWTAAQKDSLRRGWLRSY